MKRLLLGFSVAAGLAAAIAVLLRDEKPSCEAARLVKIDVDDMRAAFNDGAPKPRHAVVFERSLARLLEAIEQCAAGNGPACESAAGELAHERHWEPKNALARIEGCAERLLSGACRRGDGGQCAMLADFYHSRPDTSVFHFWRRRPSPAGLRERAKTLFHAQCKAGDRDACLDLSYHVESSDPALATESARSSCTLGNETACLRLAWRITNGEGVPSDPKAGAEILEEACARGSSEGCFNLAESFESAPLADPARAEAARIRGCAIEPRHDLCHPAEPFDPNPNWAE